MDCLPYKRGTIHKKIPGEARYDRFSIHPYCKLNDYAYLCKSNITMLVL